MDNELDDYDRITDYKTKEIECEKCGRVSRVAKHFPLRFSCCPECGSLKIRLYKKKIVKSKENKYE